jgi:hypothetical protein
MKMGTDLYFVMMVTLKAYSVLINEINTIYSQMKLWNKVQFRWPICKVIIYLLSVLITDCL